jgi:hypothetical protein
MINLTFLESIANFNYGLTFQLMGENTIKRTEHALSIACSVDNKLAFFELAELGFPISITHLKISCGLGRSEIASFILSKTNIKPDAGCILSSVSNVDFKLLGELISCSETQEIFSAMKYIIFDEDHLSFFLKCIFGKIFMPVNIPTDILSILEENINIRRTQIFIFSNLFIVPTSFLEKLIKKFGESEEIKELIHHYLSSKFTSAFQKIDIIFLLINLKCEEILNLEFIKNIHIFNNSSIIIACIQSNQSKILDYIFSSGANPRDLNDIFIYISCIENKLECLEVILKYGNYETKLSSTLTENINSICNNNIKDKIKNILF